VTGALHRVVRTIFRLPCVSSDAEVGEEPEEELDSEEAHGEPRSSFWRSWRSAKGGYGGQGSGHRRVSEESRERWKGRGFFFELVRRIGSGTWNHHKETRCAACALVRTTQAYPDFRSIQSAPLQTLGIQNR
jgi:hypothetical protein